MFCLIKIFHCKFVDVISKYKNNLSPLYFAVVNENIEIIKLFLEDERLDINFLNYDCGVIIFLILNIKTVLHQAVSIGDSEIIQLLLEHKDIDVNVKDGIHL